MAKKDKGESNETAGLFRVGRLRVALVHQPWVPYVQATVAVRAGSAYEDDHNFGYSHFLEHLVFLSGRDPRGRPLEAVETMGGELDASTGRETTFFELRIAPDGLASGLEHLGRLVFELELDAEQFEREKAVLEYEALEDNAADGLDTRAKELLWPDDLLFDDSLGDLELIRTSTPRQLERHHRRLYVPDNMLVVVAGGFDPTTIQGAVERAFLPHSKRRGEVADYSPPRTRQRKVRVESDEDGGDPLEILLSFRGWGYNHKHNLGTYMLAEILAGAQTSRLFRALREENPRTYSIESYADSFLHAGCFSVHGNAPAELLEHYLEEVCQAIVELREKGPTDDEVERARLSLARSFGADLYTPGVATDFTVRRHLLGLSPEWWDPTVFRNLLDRATSASLRATAAALFRPSRAVAVVLGAAARRLSRRVSQTLQEELRL